MSNIPRNIAGNFSEIWQYWRCATNCLLAFGCVTFLLRGAQRVAKKYFIGSCVQESLGNAVLDLQVKVKFTLVQATKTQRRSRGIALLFH